MDIKPRPGLYKKIIKRIHREERFLVIRHIVIFSVALLGSSVAFVPTIKMLLIDFEKSGFLNFFSLLFSDFSIVASYWKNFALILLETLPVLSIALFLTVLIIFLQSLKSLSRDIKILNHSRLAVN
jgi:hypothetical protein